MPFTTSAAIILIIITATILLVSSNWRSSILALAVQYLAMFLLVAQTWPIEKAVVKLLTGWVAGALLGFVLTSEIEVSLVVDEDVQREKRQWPGSRLFRLFASALLIVSVWSVAGKVIDWLPGMGRAVVFPSLLLMAAGILHIGLTGQPFRTILALLTFLTGFEILYAYVETSVLVTGLLSLINLGLALAGSYLLIVHSQELKA